MAAVWMAARARLRRRWGATVVLALLVGLAGGVVLAAVAGASRTDSAMKRFVAYSRPEDLFVTVSGPPPPPGVSTLEGPPPDVSPAQLQDYIEKTLAARDRLVHLPEVAEAGRSPYMFMSPDKDGKELGAINPFAAADGHAFRTLDRPLVVHGRLARLDRPDEAVVDEVTAKTRHLHLGSPLAMWAYTAEQTQDIAAGGFFGAIPAPRGPAYTFRVVGIIREPATVNAAPASIVGDAIYKGQGEMVLTPAFLQRFAAEQHADVEGLPGIEGFRVKLRHGLADLPGFLRQMPELYVSKTDVHTGSDNQAAADKAQRAIHLEAVALLIFAGLAGLAAFLVLGQTLGRQVAADAEDNRVLAALGMGRRRLTVIPLVRASLIALGGATVAVALAVALSPLTPLGLARRAEIDPGVSVSVAVLGLGFVAVTGLTLIRALATAWRQAQAALRDEVEQAPARPGPVTAAVAGSRLGPAAVAGVGMAFERGRGGLAFRTALLGTVVAVAGVVAAVTFGVSMRHLVDDPRQQGWNWDVVVGNPNTQPYQNDPGADPIHQRMVDLLTANKDVSAFSGFGLTDFTTVDGRAVDLAAIETVKGNVWQTIVEGRPPRSDTEIVLGEESLRQLHKRTGQTVTVAAGDRSVPMRIVGRALQPTASDLSTTLSRGGAVTLAGLRRVIPEGTPVLQFAVRFLPGVNPAAATRSLVDSFGQQVLRPYPGGEVGDLARVESLPYALAALLVVLAVCALGLTLLQSVRRHRRDLAVLKTVGFVRGQVTATVAWQATILAVAAVAVGIPAGIAIGRWTWRLVANGIGSVSPELIPIVAVLVLIPVTLLAANLLAAGPAWVAGRVKPARVLKAE